MTRSKRSHAAGFTLRYRLWRLPFSQRQRLAPAIGCPKGCREKTRSKRTPTGILLRVASLRVAMPQALRCANTSRRDSSKPTWVRWFTSCYNSLDRSNVLAPRQNLLKRKSANLFAKAINLLCLQAIANR